MNENNRVSPGRVKHILIGLGLIIFFMGMAAPPGVSPEERLVKPEWVMPKHYPKGFHGWGRIGYISEDEIAINDISFPLSPYIEYNTPEWANTTKEDFFPGKMVGYLLNSANEIISLWLIEMK